MVTSSRLPEPKEPSIDLFLSISSRLNSPSPVISKLCQTLTIFRDRNSILSDVNQRRISGHILSFACNYYSRARLLVEADR